MAFDRVWHATAGNGPVRIMFIHGWFWDHGVFSQTFEEIDGHRFTYAAFDIRGYGKSRNIPGKYSVEEIAADAINVANDLGWSDFHVLGHSMGGKAAQKLAIGNPERVRSIVAVTPVPASALPFDESVRALFRNACDEDASAADYYTVSAQKWLCGPDATGALYVREPEALAPRLIAYPSAASYDISEGVWEPKPGAARFDRTFTPATALAGLEAALVDLPAGRHERARQLAERCRELLLERGHDVVTEAGQATLVSFRPPGDPAAAVAQLYEQGVVVRDLPGTGLVRASVGWWNDESDLERLADGLGDL